MRGLARASTLLAVIGLLAAGVATTAHASKTRLFKETFGSVAKPGFGDDKGLAVDQDTGDLLVIDAAAKTVTRYHADGTPSAFTALGTNVIDAAKASGGKACGEEAASCDATPENGFTFGSGREVQVAIDNSGTATDGDIYVTQASKKVIDVFSSDGKYLGQLTAADANAFGEPCGVGVDENGNIFVGDRSGKVHRFEPSSNPVANSDHTTSFSTITEPCTLAAGIGPTAGSLFVTDFSSFMLFKISAAGGKVIYPFPEAAYRTVTVDPATGHVITALGSFVREFDASGDEPVAVTEPSKLAPGGGGLMDGVASGESGESIYFSRSAASATMVEVFGPLVSVPDATTGAASNVETTSATLNGAVDPDGAEVTECFFEYGLTFSYGQTVACAESNAAIGSGTTPVAVHADISGLAFGAEYHFRLRVKNANGEGRQGSDAVFKLKSKPVILAQWAESVDLHEATLKANINPEGFLTTYRIEWGSDATYGNSSEEFVVGSDRAVHTVGFLLRSRMPGITYHYRFVATNAIGISEGEDHSFRTFETPRAVSPCLNDGLRIGPSAQLPDCRAYEMVSPLDKNGGDIRALASQSTASQFTAFKQSSSDGNKITYTSATAFGDAEAGPWSSQYISSRGTLGWFTHGISLPRGTTVFDGKGEIPRPDWDLETLFEAFTADLCSAWVKDTNLTPLTANGLSGGFVNLYRRENCGRENLEALTNDTTVGRLPRPPFPPATEYLNEDDSAGEAVGLRFQGYARDFSHQVFVAGAALTPDAVPMKKSQLYDLRDEAHNALQSVTVRATSGDYKLAIKSARGQGIITKNSTGVSGVTSEGGAFRVGDEITGTGIPAGTSVLEANGETLILSKPASGNGKRTLTATESTGATPAGANANEVRAALEGLPAIGIGNVAVSGGPGDASGSAPLEIEFKGVLARMPVERLIPIGIGLTGGVPSSSITVEIKEPGGYLELISILPDGSANPQKSYAGTLGSKIENRQSTVEHAVSQDGSRIFWTSNNSTALATGPGKLYVRVDGTRTLPVSETVSAANARFWKADPKGSTVLFTLGEDLYRFAVDKALTEEPATTLIAHQVPGLLGASEDLSRIYFVSREALGPGALPGQNNLYLDEAGVIRLVAVLSADDVFSIGGLISPIHVEPIRRVSRITPDGKTIAFQSVAPLTGYDNVDPVSGRPFSEVFRYDAEAEELSCVSCNPTGARPMGLPILVPYTSYLNVLDPLGFGEKLSAAATLPTWEREQYSSRVLSPDGNRIYFHSYEALVPDDTNGVQDVYQWEASGEGTCIDSNGCIDLISTGTSHQQSEFYDASVSGRDVFFATTSNINPRDEGLIDVYDARVGGGEVVLPGQSPCLGDACQNIPTPPPIATPASVNFRGPRDRLRCIRGKRRIVRKGKTRCVSSRVKHSNHHRHNRRAVR